MDLEIKALRIFRQVMRNGSFSGAARSLKLTQPTISQQIARLEKELDSKLFERVGHEIIPTPVARDLLAFTEGLLEHMDEFQDAYTAQRSEPKGRVRYAMPESCQWTPHFRQIMRQLSQYPGISFEIDILPNSQIVSGIMEGRLDFGFVTGERLAPDLRFEKFSDERYAAVATRKELLTPLTSKNASELRLISYPGWELFFTTWAKAHGLWGSLKKMNRATVQIGTLAGAIHATKEGAGFAIFPRHCVSQELDSRELIELTPKKDGVATCPIYLTRKVGAKFPKRTELIMELLRKARKEIGLETRTL